jgi:hypothetical protein
MTTIDNLGTITLNRGDCFKTPLFLNIGTEKEPIRLNVLKFPQLEVFFGIYLPGSKFENSFIKKTFNFKDSNSLGDIVISLDPLDTLYVPPGKYLYTVKAKLHNDT